MLTTMARSILTVTLIGLTTLLSCVGPRAGDWLPPLDGLRLVGPDGQESGRAPDVAGRTLVLEFWATW